MKKITAIILTLSVVALSACNINTQNKKVEDMKDKVVNKVNKTYSDQDVQEALDLVKELLK